ncbi:MAG: DUF1559 domain-containing protein [Gemmataceae bacterium]
MSSGRTPHRGAFTLIELMIVIAIIGLLIGLAVPAVQKARELSMRTQCVNQLKQIALAAHQYQNDKGSLPTAGGLFRYGNPSVDRQDFGWTYEILPYIDQQNVFGLQANAAGNAQMRTTVIPTYHCPSKRQPQLYNGIAVSDYAMNVGSNFSAQDPSTTNILTDGVASVKRNNDGAFLKITFSSVSDGVSQTLMFAEKRINFPTMAGLDRNDDSDNSGWAGPGFPTGDIVRGALMPPAPDLNNPSAASAMSTEYRFGSSHSAVCPGAFVDASVHTIRFSVSATVFRALCTREGRKTGATPAARQAETFEIDDL